ncbi:hypothetical protein PFISCL1PPCAC_13009, partial [Pristionchus fissidentatus]
KTYVDPLINNFVYYTQMLIAILAYISNFFLFYLANTCAKREIGKYRFLIFFFAASDVYYNTWHLIVFPVPEVYGNAFFMRGHGMYGTLFGLGMYAGAYGHAFPIFIFHFLYRLLVLKSVHSPVVVSLFALQF